MPYAARAPRDVRHRFLVRRSLSLRSSLRGHTLQAGTTVADSSAVRMLRRRGGRTHAVHTAVAISHGGRTVSAVESVGVTFHPLSDRDISAYIETGEPMDEAGAYGIQGYGATIVKRVEGDYFSVMGLGLRCVVAMLESRGLAYDSRHGVTAH